MYTVHNGDDDNEQIDSHGKNSETSLHFELELELGALYTTLIIIRQLLSACACTMYMECMVSFYFRIFYIICVCVCVRALFSDWIGSPFDAFASETLKVKRCNVMRYSGSSGNDNNRIKSTHHHLLPLLFMSTIKMDVQYSAQIYYIKNDERCVNPFGNVITLFVFVFSNSSYQRWMRIGTNGCVRVYVVRTAKCTHTFNSSTE